MYFGDKIDERYAVPLSEVGFTFIIALVYFAIFALGFDILRILNHFFSIFPEIVTSNWTFVKQGALALSVISVMILLIVGSINFNNPVVTTYQINTEKNLPGGELKLVLVSDIHLSTSINSKHLKKYVKLINDQRGDAVFLAGDIADRDVRPLIDQKMGEELAKLSAPMGVFAITGNHEFYGGDKDEIDKILREHGFFRCHNSYIVNLKLVESMNSNTLKIGEKYIPISKYRVKELKLALTNILGDILC